MKRFNVLAVALTLSVATLGCDTATTTAPDSMESQIMGQFARGGPHPRPMIWAGAELYQAIVTPTSFKPNSQSFDELYMGGAGFKDGVPLISDAAPGYRNYNGGRWHVNTLKAGVDPNKYIGADSVDDLDLNDFESQPVYFGCPMLPIS
jgi:hypothetical protein